MQLNAGNKLGRPVTNSTLASTSSAGAGAAAAGRCAGTGVAAAAGRGVFAGTGVDWRMPVIAAARAAEALAMRGGRGEAGRTAFAAAARSPSSAVRSRLRSRGLSHQLGVLPLLARVHLRWNEPLVRGYWLPRVCNAAEVNQGSIKDARNRGSIA